MVYVDSMNCGYGRMIMCHMMADSKEELLDMATKIGVPHKWIQYPDTEHEHFDVCLSKKKRALAFGAKEIGHKELRELLIKKGILLSKGTKLDGITG